MTGSPAVPVSTLLPVSAARAFRLLEDPANFERIVAGARKVRRFDSRWPEPGTSIHHTVGIPPLLLRDRTDVMECAPPDRLLLDAHVWPLGTLAVEFRIEPRPGGSRLAVTEAPQRGPVSWPLLRSVILPLVRLRNLLICRRFRRLAEARVEAGWEGGDA